MKINLWLQTLPGSIVVVVVVVDVDVIAGVVLVNVVNIAFLNAV